MDVVHANLGITDPDFDAVVGHLVETLTLSVCRQCDPTAGPGNGLHHAVSSPLRWAQPRTTLDAVSVLTCECAALLRPADL